VAFEDINVLADAESGEADQAHGPDVHSVIVLDDEVVQCFNKPKLKSLLGI
jgi:hypothetical protein